jgi:hypothetical protein
VTREAVAAIALCLVTALAMVLMVESHRGEEVVVTTRTTTMSVVRSAGVPPADPAASPPPAEAAKEAQYIGNTNTHKFHRKGCHSLDRCVNCTAKFANREDAIAEGYRPCGNCRP